MARFSRANQRLNGLNGLAYMGNNAYQPPEFVTDTRPPTANDNKNFELGTIWLDTATNPTPTAENVWMLVSLQSGVATWVSFAGTSALESLTGDNTGVTVFGDAADNIFIQGTAGKTTVTGNNATHTLLIDLDGSVTQNGIRFLAGNSGGSVPPTVGGVVNVIGAGIVSVAGNIGTNTLTITATEVGTLNQLTGNVGVAVASGNNINVLTDNTNILFTGSGSTLTWRPSDSNFNILIGTDGVLTSGLNNTGYGEGALASATSASFNCAYGLNSLNSESTGSRNSAYGWFSMISSNGAESSSVFGQSSGGSITTGSFNDFFGVSSGVSLTTESNCICLGYGVIGIVGAEGQTIIGYRGAPVIGASGDGFIAVGGGTTNGTFMHNFPGENNNNVFVGYSAGNQTANTTTCLNNTVIGHAAAPLFDGAEQNFIGGAGAGQSATDISQCVFIGFLAARNAIAATNTVGIGYQVLNSLTTQATTGNVAIGTNSFGNIVTASNCIGLGVNSGVNHTLADSDNICIGSQGVAGESNTCRIAQIRGITTGVNDAVPVLIDSTGQLGVTSSSLRYKENVKDLGDESSVLYKLRPVTFNFKKHGPESKSVGLIAEEVHEVCPQMVVYSGECQPETVKYQDLVPMILNELIKLKKEVVELKSRM